MFSIFKRSPLPPVDLSGIRTDMHSHLLPGIDDGATDPAMSGVLIKGLQDLGIEQFITTPHIMQGMYNNDVVSIGAAFDTLQSNVDGPFPLRYAAEYFMDDHFERLLQDKKPLLTLKDQMVLFEFSFVSPPYNYKEIIFQLQINGYQPVLAHPERYLYFASHKDVFAELKNAGCHFQVNLLSLAGYYGKGAQELAQYFIKQGWVNFLGSDMHHERHLDALRHANHMMPAVLELVDSGKLLNQQL